MAYAVGQQLGNYRVARLLGQGGFAEVYLGEHVRLKMKAAIKVLYAHLSGEAIDAFQHEAQVIADLTHPNIVRVLDFDLQDGRPFLVLDYAPNGSLRQKHPRGTRVPAAQVVSYVKQIASALQYAHERKLIHRDVKPENMLVGKQGEILLSDFGIVTMAHSTSSMNTQASMGTLAYMAPEQIQGKPRKESDQYALAVAVYQWLSGAMPFQGSSTEIIAQHLGVTPPPLREKAPDIAPGVEWVVMKALSKDPRERFASMQAFARALEQAAEDLLEQQTVVANPPAPNQAEPAMNTPSSPPSHTPSTPNTTIPARQSAPQHKPVVDLVRPSPEKVISEIQSRPRAVPSAPSPIWRQDHAESRKKKRLVIWGILIAIVVVIGATFAVVIQQPNEAVLPSTLHLSATGQKQVVNVDLGRKNDAHVVVSSISINNQGKTVVSLKAQIPQESAYCGFSNSQFSKADEQKADNTASYNGDSVSLQYAVLPDDTRECSAVPSVGLPFPSVPRAGEKWQLNVVLVVQPFITDPAGSSASNDAPTIIRYDPLYMQF